jgi:hypothetical protein
MPEAGKPASYRHGRSVRWDRLWPTWGLLDAVPAYRGLDRDLGSFLTARLFFLFVVVDGDLL